MGATRIDGEYTPDLSRYGFMIDLKTKLPLLRYYIMDLSS